VIGHGKYQSAATLPNPSNSAADVAAALRELGFGCFWGAECKFWQLGDGVHVNPAGYCGLGGTGVSCQIGTQVAAE
jgi:hypothetical protein